MTPSGLSVAYRGRTYENPGAGLGQVVISIDKGMAVSLEMLTKAMKIWLTGIARDVADRHSGGWPSGTTSTTLSRRSGNLTRQILDGIRVSGLTIDRLTGTITGGEYTRIHELGGTLRARKTKYLAIPLPAALDKSGRLLHDNPRDWGNTFVQKSKQGNLLIFQRRGSDIVPLYALKTSVRIPPRLGIGDTAHERMPYFVEKALDAVLKGFSS